MTSSKPENKSQSKKSSKLNLSKVKPEIKEKNLWKPILNRKTLRAYKFEFAGFFMAITVVLLSISFLTPAPSDLKMAFAGNNLENSFQSSSLNLNKNNFSVKLKNTINLQNVEINYDKKTKLLSWRGEYRSVSECEKVVFTDFTPSFKLLLQNNFEVIGYKLQVKTLSENEKSNCPKFSKYLIFENSKQLDIPEKSLQVFDKLFTIN